MLFVILVIQEICSKANIKLYVAYVPFYGTLHERYTQPLTDLKLPPEISKALLTDPEYKKQPTQLAAICSRLAIPFTDTSKKLQDEENRNAPQFWQYDSHPRPEGYKTISQAIAELLQQPGSK